MGVGGVIPWCSLVTKAVGVTAMCSPIIEVGVGYISWCNIIMEAGDDLLLRSLIIEVGG